MTWAGQRGNERAGKGGRGEEEHQAKEDGEIKGPGPLGSMALMVLKNFRDLALGLGPGFSDFLRNISGLSGTQALGARP
jgi:hypothetical protein